MTIQIKASKIYSFIEIARNCLARAGLIGSISKPEELFKSYEALESEIDRAYLAAFLPWTYRSIEKNYALPRSYDARGMSPADKGKHAENYVYLQLEKMGAIRTLRTFGELEAEFSKRTGPRLIRYEPETRENTFKRVDGKYFHDSLTSVQFLVTFLPDLIYINEDNAIILDLKAGTAGILEKPSYILQQALYLSIVRQLAVPKGGILFSSFAGLKFSAGLIRNSPQNIRGDNGKRFIEMIAKRPEDILTASFGVKLNDVKIHAALNEFGETFAFLKRSHEYFTGGESLAGQMEFRGCRLTAKPNAFRTHHFTPGVEGSIEKCIECPIRTCAVQKLLVEFSNLSAMTHEEKILFVNDLVDGWATDRIEEDPWAGQEDEEETPKRSLHLIISNGPNANSLSLDTFNGAAVENSLSLGTSPKEAGLTPLQYAIKDHYSFEKAKHGLLIISPTASGKTQAVVFLMDELLRKNPDSTVVFMVNNKTLAEATYRELLEKFSSGKFGVSKLLKKEVAVRHGSSTDKTPLLGAKILVATYDWGLEYLETAGTSKTEKPSLDVAGIVCDEIHSRLLPQDVLVEFPDFDGAYSLTRLLNIQERISDVRNKETKIIFMSGTMPGGWRERFIANESFDVVESLYRTNDLRLFQHEAPLSSYAELSDIISQLVNYSAKNEIFKIAASDLRSFMDHEDGRKYQGSQFIPIFANDTSLLEEMAAGLRKTHGFQFDIFIYTSKKEARVKAQIERRLLAANEAKEKGEKFKPFVLFATTSIAEGVKLPSNEAIVILLGDPSSGATQPPRLVGEQQAARVGRVYNPDKKERAAAYFITLNRKMSPTKDEREEALDKKLLKLSHLGRRYAPNGQRNYHGGLIELYKRFPATIHQNTPTFGQMEKRTKRDRFISPDGSLTPLGELKLFYDNWAEPDSGSYDSYDTVELSTLFNLVVVPFITQKQFVREFVKGQSARFKNNGDSSYRALYNILSIRSGKGDIDKSAAQRLMKLLFDREDADSVFALTELFISTFSIFLAKKNLSPEEARPMILFILSGLIYFRVKIKKTGNKLDRFYHQCSFFTITSNIYDEIFSQISGKGTSRLQWTTGRFFKLAFEKSGVTAPEGWEEAVSSAISKAFLYLRDGTGKRFDGPIVTEIKAFYQANSEEIGELLNARLAIKDLL